MNIIIGLAIISICVSFGVMMGAIIRDLWSASYAETADKIFTVGSGVMFGIVVGLGVLFGLVLMFGGFQSTPLLEGSCYRAVRHSSTILVPVGKVLIPSTTSGIDLEEIRCP